MHARMQLLQRSSKPAEIFGPCHLILYREKKMQAATMSRNGKLVESHALVLRASERQ